ncbi:MAG: NAD(P)-binding domain-containing protein, partial [Enterococcus sp.]
MEIAMVGLGKMGMGIAENLLSHQHQVRGFDVDLKLAEKLTDLGGTFYSDLTELLVAGSQQK